MRQGAGVPVVTSVDITRGERTELSAASLANAAAKIANALRDEFDLAPGDSVGLHLPLHWQRAAWCAGAWTAGCVVVPDGRDVDLLVAGPTEADDLAAAGHGPISVVSLHPFGLPLDRTLPPGAEDVTLVVRQQPDAYLFEPPSPAAPALAVDGAVLDQAGVLERARERGLAWGLEPGGRLLVDDATAAPDAWLAAVATPLACSAAVVLVRGDGSSVVDQEGITAVAR